MISESKVSARRVVTRGRNNPTIAPAMPPPIMLGVQEVTLRNMSRHATNQIGMPISDPQTAPNILYAMLTTILPKRTCPSISPGPLGFETGLGHHGWPFLFHDCRAGDMLGCSGFRGASMLTFFHGWRRKTGAATLVLACVFTCGWVRSRNTRDYIRFTTKKAMYSCGSQPDGLTWKQFETPDFNLWFASPPNTSIYFQINLRKPKFDVFASDAPEPKFLGFHASEIPNQGREGRLVIRVVPYWSIVIPLTVLSAYLLLSKPRPKPKQTVKPTQPVTHA